MKKLNQVASLFLCLFCACFSQNVKAQSKNVQNYYQDGLYKFQDTWRIKKAEIFTTYLSQFGYTPNNTMILQNEGLMDNDGGESDRYSQLLIQVKLWKMQIG